MQSTARIHTKVLPGHRIEITAPEFLEGALVDVLVLPRETAIPATPLEVLRMQPDERRELLERESARLVEYYESTSADRVEWQGGDLIE